jgi:hypothetical protein
MNKIEDGFYEIATNEIVRKEPLPAVWGRAFSDSLGDKDLAIALYIKYRVAQLNEEYRERTSQAEEPGISEIAILRGDISRCPNPECHYIGAFISDRDVNDAVFALLLVCGVLPGYIYLYSGKKKYVCPECGCIVKESRSDKCKT